MKHLNFLSGKQLLVFILYDILYYDIMFSIKPGKTTHFSQSQTTIFL